MSDKRPHGEGTLTLDVFDNMSEFEWVTLLPEIRATIEERDRLRAAVNAAELRGQDTGMALMRLDNDRLRVLIKQAEWDGRRGREDDACCPWCQVYEDERHLDTCPAFTPDGTVR